MEPKKNKAEEYATLKAENANKVHISFSEFTLFNQCGYRHLLEKHLGLIKQPPSIHLHFGNAVHSAIEHSLRNSFNIDQMVGHFRSTFTKSMMDDMKDTSVFKNDFFNFLEQGEQFLKVIELENILRDYEIIAIEEALYENLFMHYFFKGFIDLVVRHKVTKRYKIIDWKTSGSDWDVKKKKKDQIFLAQMRFYKFFWGRKNNVPLDQIDCGYVVLNRLTDKKNPNSYPGRIQEVVVESTIEEIKDSLSSLASTIKSIHIDKEFLKIKHTKGNSSCIFCPLKGGIHPMCNSSESQYKNIIMEHKKSIIKK